MAAIAVCPGSYDPPTFGHLDVIGKACALFDDVRAVVVHNPDKQPMFEADRRAELLREALAERSGFERVRVDTLTDGLLVDYCRRVGARALVKGVRNDTDVAYEMPMAIVNRDLGGVETVLVLPDPRLAHVSSSLVRQVAELGGDVSGYVPANVAKALKELAELFRGGGR